MAVRNGGYRSPELGNKLDYLFGKSKGDDHSVTRSLSLSDSLEQIGIRDNPAGRKYMTEQLVDALFTTNNVLGPGTTADSIIKESLIAGPYGFRLMQSAWIDNKLVTIYLLWGKF